MTGWTLFGAKMAFAALQKGVGGAGLGADAGRETVWENQRGLTCRTGTQARGKGADFGTHDGVRMWARSKYN